LAAAKARGQQLGAYRNGVFVGRRGTPEDAERAREARTALFKARMVNITPLLRRIDPESVLSLRAIAERLNDMNVPTVTGKGSWSANSVRRLKAI